jgi:hypothetical protein
MRDIGVLILATAFFACGHAAAQAPTPSASPGQLTLSAHFETSLGPTSAERGIKSVGEQIEAKRAAVAAHFNVSPIFDLAIWRYLPADPERTLNSRVASDDDPFFTPEYLKVSGRQLDYQLKMSEQVSQELLR